MEITLWICFIAGVLFGLDTLLLWMEAKGWLYYRKVKRKSSGAGGFLDASSAFEPCARFGAEAQEERAGEEDDDDGDDDARRKSEDRLT